MEVAKNLLRYVYSQELLNEYWKIVKKNCNGCAISHKSQTQHSCCFPDNENPDWYREAEPNVDHSRVKLIFIIAAHRLHLNSKELDADAEMNKVLEKWRAEDFDLSEDLRVPEEWYAATCLATKRIELLEKRLEKWSL